MNDAESGERLYLGTDGGVIRMGAFGRDTGAVNTLFNKSLATIQFASLLDRRLRIDVTRWRKRPTRPPASESDGIVYIKRFGVASRSNSAILLRESRDKKGVMELNRAAENRDELAPFHCPVPSVLPTER